MSADDIALVMMVMAAIIIKDWINTHENGYPRSLAPLGPPIQPMSLKNCTLSDIGSTKVKVA